MEAWKQFGDILSSDDIRMPTGALAPAEEILRKGLAFMPDNRALRLELAQVCLSRFDCEIDTDEGKAEEAARIYRELHDEDPSSMKACLGLAELAHRQRDRVEFERLVDETERRVSSSTDPEDLDRFIVLMGLVPETLGRAEKLLRARLERDPGHFESRFLLALLMETHDASGSARELEKVRHLMSKEDFDRSVEESRALLHQWGSDWWEAQDEQ